MAPAKVRTQIHRQLSAPMIDDAEQSVVPGQEFREVPVDELLTRSVHVGVGCPVFGTGGAGFSCSLAEECAAADEVLCAREDRD